MLSGKGRRIAAAGFLVGACGALALALFGSPVGATPGGQSPAHQIYTDPQSASNGDFSGNGANTHGPYDSTRDGSPAMNGNGGGKGVGKPCAGCVGKADNKNPPGQMPGGSDGNAGYECDRNNGIGKSNPAHTGCTSGAESSPPPSSPGETQTPSSPGETPTPSTSPPSSGPGDTSTPSTPAVEQWRAGRDTLDQSGTGRLVTGGEPARRCTGRRPVKWQCSARRRPERARRTAGVFATAVQHGYADRRAAPDRRSLPCRRPRPAGHVLPASVRPLSHRVIGDLDAPLTR